MTSVVVLNRINFDVLIVISSQMKETINYLFFLTLTKLSGFMVKA